MDQGRDEEALLSALESVLLVAGGPVPIPALAHALQVPRARIHAVLAPLAARLTSGIRLQVDASAVQLVSAPENAAILQRFLGVARPPLLTRSALEALTVVAYQQPVTRPEVESVRGVNSDRALQTLVARGLIEERGRRASPGRPMQYGTTFAFLEYFGLQSLSDLPPLPDQPRLQGRAAQLGLRGAESEADGQTGVRPPE